MEIISVDAGVGPYTKPAKHFAQRCDSELISDRSLFQDDLKEIEGVIIHLGDYSDTPNDPCWFCGHFVEYLEDDDEGNHFRINNNAYKELREVLSSMQRQSPTGHVIFLSDYQFGPEEAQRVDLDSINDLDDLNRDTAIRYNTLYHINRKAEQGSAHQSTTRSESKSE